MNVKMGSRILLCVFTTFFLPWRCVWSQEAGKLLWTAPVSSPSSPAIGQDGTVYAGSLSAFAPSGSNKWALAISPSLGNPAIGYDGTIYIGSHDDAKLYAVEPDGTVKWTFDAGGPVGSTPALGADGTIYFYSGGHKLFAVNPDGTKKWDFFVGEVYIAPSPVVAKDGTILVGAYPNKLVAVHPNGSKKWEFTAGSVVAMPAAIMGNGSICVAAGEFIGQSLYLLDQSGGELWRNETSSLVTSPVIGKDGTIYVGSFNPTQLHAVDSKDGRAKWSGGGGYNTRFSYYSSAAIAENGLIYYGEAAVNGSSYFYAFNPDGSTNWQYLVKDPVVGSPAIGKDGTIYFCTPTMLYALRGNSPLANSPWPKFRQNSRNTGKVEQPALEQSPKRGDAGFEFQLYPQQLGLSYTIEASADLNNWMALTSFVATTLPVPVLDLQATNFPARFYRAMSP